MLKYTFPSRENRKLVQTSLEDILDWDHVVEVHANGDITTPNSEWAPTLFNGELDSSDWTMIDGYSLQYCYSGPIMHDSEGLHWGMCEMILDNPGYYVKVPAYYDDEDNPDESITEGWALCFKESA